MVLIDFIFAGVNVNDDIAAIARRFQKMAKLLVIDANSALDSLAG